MMVPPLKKIAPGKYPGLGDVVALAARPIARTLDRYIGTNLSNCPSCAARRRFLNRHFPHRRAPEN